MTMADLGAGAALICGVWHHNLISQRYFNKALGNLVLLINFSIYSNSSKTVETKEYVTIFKICAARSMFWWVHLLTLGVIYQAAKKRKKN